MSYCVNCGVELAESEKHCPLCGVEVFNPAKPWQEQTVRPYPQRLETIVQRIDRRYLAGLISMLLLIPLCITVLINLLTEGAITWSVYVIGGIALLFCSAPLPCFFKKPRPILCVSINVAVLLLFLWTIDWMHPGANWFWPFACPLTLTAAVFLLAILFLFRTRVRRLLTRTATVLFAIGAFLVCLEVLLNLYLLRSPIPTWSCFPLIPCWVLAGVLLLVRSRTRLLEEIHRRLFT